MKALYILFICFSFVSQSLGQDKAIVKVVGESWDGYTNQDGTGLYFDIIKKVFKNSKYKLSIKTMPWKRASLFVERKRADILVGSYFSDNEKLIFPKRHLAIEEAVVAFYKKTKLSKFNNKKINSFIGKRIAWIRGYGFEDSILKDVHDYKMIEVTELKQALKMLDADRIDIILDYKSTIKKLAKKMGFVIYPWMSFDEVKAGKKLYLAFTNTKRSLELIAYYEKRMNVLVKTQDLKNICKKWGISIEKLGLP